MSITIPPWKKVTLTKENLEAALKGKLDNFCFGGSQIMVHFDMGVKKDPEEEITITNGQ